MNARPQLSSVAGHVRVLVIGDSGVGKSSLVHLVVNGWPTLMPERTVGCAVHVKLLEYVPDETVSGQLLEPETGQLLKKDVHFVEIWDISGHEEYKRSRKLFYSQINGVIFVHDLSRRKTRNSAVQWTAELTQHGTFATPSNPSAPGALPVPLLVIGNKDDIRERDPLQKGTSKLVEMLSQIKLVETLRRKLDGLGIFKRFGEQSILPDYIRNPRTGGLVACAREGRLDIRAVDTFFKQLIKRRYYTENVQSLPSPSRSWRNPYFGLDTDDGPFNGVLLKKTDSDELLTRANMDAEISVLVQ